jgi:hypothetical protein
MQHLHAHTREIDTVTGSRAYKRHSGERHQRDENETRRGRTRAEHAPEATNRLAAAPACCWLWTTRLTSRSARCSAPCSVHS